MKYSIFSLSMMRKSSIGLIRSVWLFPVILTLIILSLTLLRVSGTSIGTYREVLYGKGNDPSLIINHPSSIRSDEWLVTTQLTIAQNAAGYPRVNPNIDTGRDMSVVGDAPYKEWSAAFKPQNLAFFVLPFENAFAFKWWILLYGLLISCYFFALHIFKNRRLFASLFSLAISFSPFVFWWYTTGTLAPLMYGFILLLLAVRIISGKPVRLLKHQRLLYSQIIYILVLAYVLACFALVLYPPFQIPIAIAVAFCIIGQIIQKYGLSRTFLKDSLTALIIFSAGAVLASAVVLTFVQTRSNVVTAINNTVYPGKRTVKVRGNSGYEILSTYLQPQLQRSNRAANYYTNQSEASNFILLLPFLFLPGFLLLLMEYLQKKRVNWHLLSSQLCASLFLAYLFIPFLRPLYHLIFLDKVANTRLFIGLGFIGAIQLLYILKSLDAIELKRSVLTAGAGVYSLVVLFVLVMVGQATRTNYPKFIYSWLLIAGLAIFFSTIVFSFLSKRQLLGVILLFAFSFVSIAKIHPLYQGLGPYYHGKLSRAIESVSKPGDAWANLDGLVFENAPLFSNRDSISGVKPYPDINFWRQVEGPRGDFVYNRYAHVFFNSSMPLAANDSEQLHLTGLDSFSVQFGCTQFVEKYVNFALSTHRLDYSCIRQVDEVHYPAITFYIYKVL